MIERRAHQKSGRLTRVEKHEEEQHCNPSSHGRQADIGILDTSELVRTVLSVQAHGTDDDGGTDRHARVSVGRREGRLLVQRNASGLGLTETTRPPPRNL